MPSVREREYEKGKRRKNRGPRDKKRKQKAMEEGKSGDTKMRGRKGEERTKQEET